MNNKGKCKGQNSFSYEWVYGDKLEKDGKIYIVCDFELSCDDGENTDLYATEWYEVIPETVGQYTGLKDKF